MLTKNKKRIVYGILVLMWMCIIFMFSSQNGTSSQGTSDVFTKKFAYIMDNYFGISFDSLESISFVVRKGAHFLVYFVGGSLVYNFVNTCSLKKRKVIFISIIIGILYAFSDEFHQFFVAGRAAQFRDVLIDVLGFIISIILRSRMLNIDS